MAATPPDRALDAACSRPVATTGGSSARPSRARARRELAPLPDDLHPALLRRPARAPGSTQLYAHQAEALRGRLATGPTIVTTGTASGKSLCFNLPTLDVLCRDAQGARAVPLPDQGAGPGPGARAARARPARRVRPAIYDGDTPREERAAIRQRANLVLTNPDMLHVGILPNHPRVGRLLRQPRGRRRRRGARLPRRVRLARGQRAAAAAPDRRRLRHRAALPARVSATIANPVELAERLTGLEDSRSSTATARPRRARQIAMWNPPLLDEALQHARARALRRGGRAARRARARAARGRSASSSRARRSSWSAKLVADRLADEAPELADRVAPYRAGYTPAAAPRARAPADRRRAARASSRPTRSSSASTSARSTPRSS